MSTATASPFEKTVMPATPEIDEDVAVNGPYHWTRDEYHKLAEAGFFDDKRVELLDGVIWTMPPQLTPHAVSVGNTRRTLEAAFGPEYFARDQAPIILDDGSEPEPDVVIVPGIPNDYFPEHPHPAQIEVLVEVSDRTLRDDRHRKAQAYARAGVADYWIVDLVNRRLEVRRDPSPDGQYQAVQIYRPDEMVSLLALPAVSIQVADLLPPVPQSSQL